MNSNNSEAWVILAIVVVAALAAVWLITRERKRRLSARLREHFGPEYGRLVAEKGDRAKAESELIDRQKRVEKLNIVSLSSKDAERFRAAWDALQIAFIDHPREAVVEADRLVRDLMVRRGYPKAVFEHRAADISVEYPKLVETYRSARAIAVRDQQGKASTEELRKAVVYYRVLFDELLEIPHPTPAPTHSDEVMHS